jgi:hypothetical protein
MSPAATDPGRDEMARSAAHPTPIGKPTPQETEGKSSKFLISLCPGGAEGSRTPDLLIANEALYQLSYGPRTGCAPGVGPGGEGGHKSGSRRRVNPATRHIYLLITMIWDQVDPKS